MKINLLIAFSVLLCLNLKAQNPEQVDDQTKTVSIAEDGYRTFTLRNNSARSIPLLIPSVMNPNLSPFSNSGVSLKLGQKILFKEGRKKYVLFIVSEDIENDATIEVSKLLKQRKEELGLE